MLFPFVKSENKKRGKTVLILDIGSGSVAGSFVELAQNKNPKVMYVKRVPMKFVRELSGNRFKKGMFTALGVVLDDLSKKGLSSLGSDASKKRIKKVYCSLASPWFVSQTKTVKIKKEEPFVITSKFISDFLNREEGDFENSNLSKYGSGRKQESEVIERKLIDMKLNGYKVGNPLGKKAKEAELTLFLSMSQTSILDEIEDVITKYFYTEDLTFHSFTLVSFSAIRDMYDRVTDFLLLDIAGEVTDISLVKQGNVLKTMSFPVGKNTLLRFLAEELRTSSEEALSSLRLFYTESLFGGKIDKLRKSITKVGGTWLREFRNALTTLSTGDSVPSTIFFTADEDLSNFYNRLMKSEEFSQSIMTDGLFVVSFVNCSSLDSYVLFKTKEEKDTFIAIEAIFFNRVFELER